MRYQVRVRYEGEPEEDHLFESEHRFKWYARFTADTLNNIPRHDPPKAIYFVLDTRRR